MSKTLYKFNKVGLSGFIEMSDVTAVSPPLEVEKHIEIEVHYKDAPSVVLKFNNIVTAIKVSQELYLVRKEYLRLLHKSDCIITQLKMKKPSSKDDNILFEQLNKIDLEIEKLFL